MRQFRHRSLLFVPALADRHLDRATERGADAIILDLEDGIPPSRKQEARGRVAALAADLRAKGAAVWVRINSGGADAALDIAAATCKEVEGFLLPKIPRPEALHPITALIAAAEARHHLPATHIKLIPLVETAAGLLNGSRLGSADGRIVALAFGSEDFATELGVEPSPESLSLPAQMVAIAAAAAGIAAIGVPGPLARFDSPEGFFALAQKARLLGFSGALCIHPAQVEPCNRAFTPTAADLAQAEAVVMAFDAALDRGEGIASLHGQMIDPPVAQRARRLLAQRR